MRERRLVGSVMALGMLLAMLLVTSVALAQTGDGYDLSWGTVDGGGYTSAVGGDYELGGTAGQPDAGCMEEDTYRLCGGFWPGSGVEPGHPAYLPLVLKRYPR